MASEKGNNLRLGIFVFAGLFVLMIALYAVGKNQSLFGERFRLKARFRNINGLMVGNNIRYSGIQTGTVGDIEVINDTTIEVSMLIDKKMQPYIRSSATASIGSEGLMGNKVINITPGKEGANLLQDGDMLTSATLTSTENMLETLSVTNVDVQVIAGNLKEITRRLTQSKAMWDILNDTAVARNLALSMANISNATSRINKIAEAIDTMVENVSKGKGLAGAILTDEKAGSELRNVINDISVASEQTKRLIADADSTILQFQRLINNGSGPAHAVFTDTSVVGKLNRSMSNIEKGTEAFEKNMEALKHNFLTRGYFRKQQKKGKTLK